MLTLDKNAALAWLEQRGLMSDEVLLVDRFIQPLRFVVPSDSGRKAVFSLALTSLFKGQDGVFLWINEYGIWPNSEDWNLFDGYRKSLGVVEPLWEKPCHVFSAGEIESLRSLLLIALYFSWGAILAPPDGSHLVRLSHDDYVDVYRLSASANIETRSVLGKLTTEITEDLSTD